jgi:hypothetical protein
VSTSNSYQRRTARWGLALITILSLVVLPLRGTPASAATTAAKTCTTTTVTVHGKVTHKKVCTQPNAVLAQQLAASVYTATSDTARQAAILAVMKALHIGVYDETTGKAINRGEEYSPRDFFLYRYELATLSGAIERGETRTPVDLAAVLTAIGIKPGGRAVEPDTMRLLLHYATQGAMLHPDDKTSLVLLLVRELGLHHSAPYDLNGEVPADKVQLDALQYLLVEADLLGPIMHRATQVKGGLLQDRVSIATFLCQNIKISTSLFNPFTYLDGSQVPLGYILNTALGNQIADLVSSLTKLGTVADSVNMASTVAYAIHAMVLAYSLKVETLSPNAMVTHYGPAGHFSSDDGKPLVFAARVVMQDDYGDAVRKCAETAGFTLPKKGPVPGVGISWMQDGDEEIEKYGTVTYAPTDEKTGPDGISKAIFTPKDETVPNVGVVVTKEGGYSPRALWGMAFENPLATINQLITPKTGPEVRWAVNYHKARGFRFGPLKIAYHVDHPLVVNNMYYKSEDILYTYYGHVCGDSLSKPWQVNVQFHDAWQKINGTGGTQDVSNSTAWNSLGKDLVGDPIGAHVTGHIISGQHPSIRFDWNTPSTGDSYSPASGSVTLPLEDNPSCPDTP